MTHQERLRESLVSASPVETPWKAACRAGAEALDIVEELARVELSPPAYDDPPVIELIHRARKLMEDHRG